MRALLDLQLTRDLAQDCGLSEADYDVLSNVSEAAGHSLRLGDLAAHMLWSKSRLSHHVARMERRGLVARQDCPSDGRGAVLTLTEAGWQAIRDAAPGHVESVRRHFLDLLTEEQVRGSRRHQRNSARPPPRPSGRAGLRATRDGPASGWPTESDEKVLAASGAGSQTGQAE